MIDELVPVIAILSTIALPVVVGLILGAKKLGAEHKERMGLINQGIIPPDATKKKTTPNRFVSLRNGIILVALGIGIIVGFLCSEYLIIGRHNEFWMIASSIVFFLGLGYLAYFFVTKNMLFPKEEEEQDQQ